MLTPLVNAGLTLDMYAFNMQIQEVDVVEDDADGGDDGEGG